MALRLASNSLKNDKDIVLAAVTQNGSTLQFASDSLRSDQDFMRRVGAVAKYI